MKTYFYDFDNKSGFKMSQASLEFDDKTNTHSMRITIGDADTSIEVYPEDLPNIYEGKVGEDLVHRIRRAVISQQTEHNQNYVNSELGPMINEYVHNIAKQMQIGTAHASISGGINVACVDYRLDITSEKHVVSTMLTKSELEIIENRTNSGFLELKIRTALERLELIIQSHNIITNN